MIAPPTHFTLFHGPGLSSEQIEHP
jgi:hypothetical protein